MDVSVNLTVRGSIPLVGEAEKDASGAVSAETLMYCDLLVVLAPMEFLAVRMME